jgi:NAD(P)H-hydrate repair Nnr-like enzyme with NAD(P)H-hydrate dehydratase domain
VLLKGADTVIAAPDGRAAIRPTRRRGLRRPDRAMCWQGLLAGCWRSVPAFEAACIGAWMHGEAGQEFGPGLIAEDLPEVLPAVLRNLYDELGIAY